MVGVYPEMANPPAFPPDGLRMLNEAHLPNVRHLSLQTEEEDESFGTYNFDWGHRNGVRPDNRGVSPSPDAPRHLRDGRPKYDVEPLPPLPNLHTLYCAA